MSRNAINPPPLPRTPKVPPVSAEARAIVDGTKKSLEEFIHENKPTWLQVFGRMIKRKK